MEKKKTIIFLLSGKAESGKDKVAQIIIQLCKDKKVKKVSYAYYLKHYIKEIFGWDGKEETKPRTLLQNFGYSFLREKIDPYLLIRRTCEDIQVFSYFYDIILVTDARLKEEIEIPKQKFPEVYSIRIERNDWKSKLTEEEKKHETETALDQYSSFDYVLQNEEHMEENIEKIVREVIYE